jgi:hypothetical protein
MGWAALLCLSKGSELSTVGHSACFPSPRTLVTSVLACYRQVGERDKEARISPGSAWRAGERGIQKRAAEVTRRSRVLISARFNQQ